MLRKILHIIVWISVLAYIGITLAFTERADSSRKVEDIKIEMADSMEYRFINRDDVLEVLENYGFKIIGMPVDSINRSAIKEAVYDIQEVKDVNVFYTHENNLNIRIWQRRPVVRIKSGNKDYYLDEDDNPFASTSFSPRVMVMTGNISVDLATAKLFDLAIFIRDDKFLSSLIQGIYVNEKRQLEIISRIENQRIFLGEPDDYEWKFTKLKAFYEKAIPEMGWDRYSSIDLRYGDQVVCKKTINNNSN